MPKENMGNQIVSARFLERIEDDLQNQDGLPFEDLNPDERIKYGTQLKDALPQLLTAHRNQVLTGKADTALDPDFLRFLGSDEEFPSEAGKQAFTAKFRQALPVLINSYRMEIGLPLRMR